MISRKTPLSRSKHPIRKNAKRHKAEFARTFHSPERVEWVRLSLPCAGCGRSGCHNAHTENEGKSRRGHYSKIAPLCYRLGWEIGTGCHYLYDNHLAPFDTEEAREKIKAAAVETQRLWLIESGEAA